MIEHTFNRTIINNIMSAINTSIAAQIKEKKGEISHLYSRKLELETLLASQKTDWVVRQISAPLDERLNFTEELAMVKFNLHTAKTELRILKEKNSLTEDSCVRVELYWGEIQNVLYAKGLGDLVQLAKDRAKEKMGKIY